MKILYIMFFLICASCSNEFKAKQLVKTYLKESLHNYKSYESVKFGKLDSLYTTIDNDCTYRMTVDSCEKYAKLLKKHTDLLTEFLDQAKLSYSSVSKKVYLDHAEKERNKAKSALLIFNGYQTLADSLELNFQPSFIGWSLNHSFRCTNAAGNINIYHYKIHFNHDVSEIIDVKDNSSAL